MEQSIWTYRDPAPVAPFFICPPTYEKRGNFMTPKKLWGHFGDKLEIVFLWRFLTNYEPYLNHAWFKV